MNEALASAKDQESLCNRHLLARLLSLICALCVSGAGRVLVLFGPVRPPIFPSHINGELAGWLVEVRCVCVCVCIGLDVATYNVHKHGHENGIRHSRSVLGILDAADEFLVVVLEGGA